MNMVSGILFGVSRFFYGCRAIYQLAKSNSVLILNKIK